MANVNREIAGVRTKLSSPGRIRELSSGEVKKPETINYRTLRPEKDGLFCERIFGPTRSYECACGKYKRSGPKFRGVVCDRCGVEVTDNRVRRERMGHIELAAPVVHIWYLRGIPSRLSLLLGASTKELEKVVYFAPTRRREKVYKVVSEGRRIDLARRGKLISASEERIHRFYDPKFKAEEAFRITKVEEINVDEGDVITASQVNRILSEYGDELFKTEPAYRMFKEGDEQVSNAIIAESKIKAMKEADSELKFERAVLNNQDAFIVTSVVHLPFVKNDVISESEYRLYNQKYPKRFQTVEETETLEDPCYIVINGGESPFDRADIILEREETICAAYDKTFGAGIGAEGVYTLLEQMDIDLLVSSLREDIAECSGQKKRKLVKRLQVAEDFRKSDSKPGWMVLSVLPVIPPDLRPMVQLDGGRFATSDLNDLYRRVINRNNRLRKLQELKAPEIIVRNEKRMLQESVDALIDNGRRGKAVLGAGNRPLKSLTDLLRGKKGRFRQNLLGKRVDYSGRSVIVIGPSLKLYQCGLPKQMALELFKPFVMHKLVESGLTPNVKSARRFIERGRDEVWGILEGIIKDHPVMLNRAPTLHRLGIQAFEPVLIEGKAIRLHPLVCTAFNADFDGDQMAVHVPLSLEAQTEARVLMLSSNNLLSPASGKPVVIPTQDIILGVFFLTSMRNGLKGEGLHFSDVEDVMSSLDHSIVNVNSKIRLKADPEWKCETVDGKWIETSPGRVLFNSALHPDLRYINKTINKKEMGSLLDTAYDKVGQTAMVEMLDEIKTLGYRWSTYSGISLGVGDVIVPPEKKEILDVTLVQEEDLTSQFEMGILTEDEYMRQKDILWSDAGRRIADKIMDSMKDTNPLKIMVDSGARGSRGQVAQMAGIRGLMADPSGRIIRYPIVANFKEGLNTLEYFISTHGARKGLADTALRTAKSGYLTRRLVDVAQDLIIMEEDCGTEFGVEIRPLLQQDGKATISMSERLTGRTSLRDIPHPVTGEPLLVRDEEISAEKAEYIESIGITSVWVRSPLTCGLRHGICRACYGRDLGTRKRVAIGESVGVVAAQSIGEPGTQLTMRTFHTGGVRQFTGEDITQGLPRIEQLFEVRRPKKVAILAEVGGTLLEIREMDGKKKLIIGVVKEDGSEERISYNIPASQNLLSGIEEGCTISKGMLLTEGYIDPQQLLEVEGLEAVQHYLLDGIQEVYRSQGVSINDKHIETILRKVAPVNRVRVLEEGDSSFVSGELVWKEDLEDSVRVISDQNQASLDESYNFLRDCKIVDAPGDIIKKESDAPDQITKAALGEMLKPGGAAGELLVQDKDGELRVVLGDASFRRATEGLELIKELTYEGHDEVIIKAGTRLSATDLAKIVAMPPRPMLVRDTNVLDESEDAAWFAADVEKDGKVIIPMDALVDSLAIKTLSANNINEIKLWKSPEHINLTDSMHHVLIEHYFGKPLTQAINSDGEVIENIIHSIDGSIVRGIVEGSISGIESEGNIITREKVIRQVLTERALGKVLLENVKDEKGNIVAEAGQEITSKVLDNIASSGANDITVRPKQAPSDFKQLIQRISFVRRLREEPQWRPVVHGVTKAALATDSFLSAASFQQTAQVLAASAVRGDVDNLVGLKENVIIGLLIPAGTGIERYRKVEITENAEPTVSVHAETLALADK
ncbi:MAG: DNA-directed RNA polymerase subunit beta' [Synergistaceae bacterium]|jgi:DNA-directed RNA polymerase subunit beta'|nr:DNA-directed RNA polymerase subunit beta' [Synergistaceae bacterium]PKL04294.1 MAG: DNA-directed RNA polymerase subunit beta' [Synergistetes bacterium HGW-Synergistetes-1]MBP9559173.1 DNA-directed RNA polymerase subunit beta' [Synergistaceae bacterium]MCE5183380.1 DNA-directed RNA polymerase subunit beta' [Synergistaceae bacterium]MDD4751082.1 DNA-directed RNA polymerase subunit beta' [Synergistaceae bacterium]